MLIKLIVTLIVVFSIIGMIVRGRLTPMGVASVCGILLSVMAFFFARAMFPPLAFDLKSPPMRDASPAWFSGRQPRADADRKRIARWIRFINAERSAEVPFDEVATQFDGKGRLQRAEFTFAVHDSDRVVQHARSLASVFGLQPLPLNSVRDTKQGNDYTTDGWRVRVETWNMGLPIEAKGLYGAGIHLVLVRR